MNTMKQLSEYEVSQIEKVLERGGNHLESKTIDFTPSEEWAYNYVQHKLNNGPKPYFYQSRFGIRLAMTLEQLKTVKKTATIVRHELSGKEKAAMTRMINNISDAIVFMTVAQEDHYKKTVERVQRGADGLNWFVRNGDYEVEIENQAARRDLKLTVKSEFNGTTQYFTATPIVTVDEGNVIVTWQVGADGSTRNIIDGETIEQLSNELKTYAWKRDVAISEENDRAAHQYGQIANKYGIKLAD